MTFFFDNCVSRKIARIISDTRRSEIVHLYDEFPRERHPSGVEDAVWIPVVGQHSWVLVSGDLAILRNPLERHALEKACIASYFVFRDFPALGAWEQLKWMITVWDELAEHAEHARLGTHYQIRRDGTIVEITHHRQFR